MTQIIQILRINWETIHSIGNLILGLKAAHEFLVRPLGISILFHNLYRATAHTRLSALPLHSKISHWLKRAKTIQFHFTLEGANFMGPKKLLGMKILLGFLHCSIWIMFYQNLCHAHLQEACLMQTLASHV